MPRSLTYFPLVNSRTYLRSPICIIQQLLDFPFLQVKSQLRSNQSFESLNQVVFNHYGIRSLCFSHFAPCFLPNVLEDCSPGPAGSLGRGTNADCHLPITGCCQPLRHSKSTDLVWVQSKVLLVLYDVSVFVQLIQSSLSEAAANQTWFTGP